MNPQQSSPVPSQPVQPAKQAPVHVLTPDELKELGLVAIEEPQALPELTPEIQDTSEIVVPLQVVPPPPPPAPLLPPAQDPLSMAVPPISVQPPMAEAPMTPFGQPGDQPSPAPNSVVLPTTPPVPDPTDMFQPLNTSQSAMPVTAPAATPSRAADVAVPVPAQQAELPPLEQSAPPQPVVPVSPDMMNNSERMELSANSIQMRKVGRLHTLNVLLYILIFALAAGVVIGGFYLRKYLISGA
jgi:hypothetical protein